jgi:hypothetical protein
MINRSNFSSSFIGMEGYGACSYRLRDVDGEYADISKTREEHHRQKDKSFRKKNTLNLLKRFVQ